MPVAAGNQSSWRLRELLGSKAVLGTLGWILFIGGWWFAAQSGIAPARLFPGPDKVFLSLYELLAEKEFASDIWASVKRILLSFSIAVAIALPFGLLMGAYRPVDRLLGPLAGAFRYLPAPAFIPLLLMWLGTGDEQKIALLVIGVLFFLIIMIADVTRQVPRVYTETARTLGLREPQILVSVILRCSLPGYVDVFRQLLAVSWTYLVIAEIVAATDGIGAMMMRAKRFVHIDDIMAGILVIGLLGLFFDALFKALHRGAFRYLESR
ncbi:MAG: ABC transporter permease [Gammaproteobacteria bacterium]|nr:ABC transporter permease [Gammaproteobacteria bacterium]